MTFIENLDRVAGSAICGFLQNGGNAALANFVVGGLMTPGAQVPSAVAGLGLLALNYGCSFDPNTGAPTTGDWSGCRKAGSGTLRVRLMRSNGTQRDSLGGVKEILSIYQGYAQSTPTILRWGVEYKDINFATQKWLNVPVSEAQRVEVVLEAGATCAEYYDPSDPVKIPPVVVNDIECNVNVEHLAWYQNAGGAIQPVLKISSAGAARASGGVISGCNWPPSIYMPPGGGGGGGPIIPWTPSFDLPGPDGGPGWLDAIKAVADDAAVALGKELLTRLFETRTQPVVYRLRTVCEVDADGEPINSATEVPIPSKDLLNSLVDRVDALTVLLQAHKDYKQPICPPERFKAAGEPVTVTFESDEPSSAGERPLVKRFSYRDQNSGTLEAQVAHWEGFVWQAGPVCVIHKGASWGVPQVWASSADEGKRVIRHAGAIAGVDPDATGEWLISGSADQRYGRTGTMRVQVRSGVIRVSKRIGASGLPQVAVAAAAP
ncbi:MAG: hypothetical protein QM522_11480 [Chitinophagaceae bacterium]|nr:hypothetical protein [Chitinophagaceae bacterium]